MADPNDSRAALTSRVLPQMAFSDGSFASMTGPPPPMPHYLNSEGRAMKRFAIEGNAVLTGGGGELALITARTLLEHGATGLCLIDLSFSLLALAEIDSLKGDFPSAKIMHEGADVTSASSLEASFNNATSRLRTIDILVTFAGVVGCTHAIDMTAEEFRKTLDVNTTGTFLSAQAAAKRMVNQPYGGNIVFIASISGSKVNFPQPQAAYNASKAAVVSLKSSLAAEWAVHGIRVNAISPGYMDTVLNAGEGLEEARRMWTGRNPMGRMGVGEELAGVVVMLCSAAGSYITGSEIKVDGGQSTI